MDVTQPNGSVPRSFLWLAGALLVSFFVGGHWSTPLAAWIAPVFMLRFVRDESVLRGYLLGALGIAAVGFVTWQGFVPLSGAPFYGFVVVLSLIGFVPYLVDRLLTPQLAGLQATLVFPTAVTFLEYALSFGDYGSWGAVAYTQQNLSLLQLTAVTGIWGITFLIHWTASVAATAWETGVRWNRIGRPVPLCAGVLVLVLVGGSLRLTFTTPSETIPVSTVSGPRNASTFFSSVDTDDTSALRDSTRSVQQAYLNRARRAARAGAHLVSWPEAAVPVLADSEATFLDRAGAVAQSENVLLALGIAVLPASGGFTSIDNEVAWIGPDGSVRHKYLKARPVPGEPSRQGDGTLPIIETGSATFTSAICFDMDFPPLLRQAGRKSADVIVAPSNDWAEIGPLHAHMARVRAIENGAALVRPTSNGRTLVADPLGRTLGEVSDFATDTNLLTAHVPTQGTWTLYPLIGDVFAWACGAGLFVLVGVSAIPTLRRKWRQET